MSNDHKNRGVVLIMVVFVVALVSAIVIGMLQLNTEDIQIMRNHIHAAEALAIAEAGLNDALSQLRMDANWDAGFEDKPFPGGTYTVTMEKPNITSVATSSKGFVAKVQAEVTIGAGGPPYGVAINRIWVNQ
jgi:Tfp pilus assembly protein PilX